MSSTIIRMVERDLERPNYGPDPAEGAYEGDPVEITHEYHSVNGTSSGVWECTPGRMLEQDHALDEFCTIIAGRVTLIDNADQTEETFTIGDSFFLPRGSSLTWVVHETVRKFYMTAE